MDLKSFYDEYKMPILIGAGLIATIYILRRF